VWLPREELLRIDRLRKLGLDAAADEQEARARAYYRDYTLRPFEAVADRDLVTLVEAMVGREEFYSMLAAARLLMEVSWRELWGQVVERRAAALRRAHQGMSADHAADAAQEQIAAFRAQEFPEEPALTGVDEADAVAEWTHRAQLAHRAGYLRRAHSSSRAGAA